MTYPTPPARGGMPPWAKWTMIGCGGCLGLTVLAFAGCGLLFYQTIGKNMKWETLDVSRKPDPPLTAKAGQLLPPRVGPFVRASVGTPAPQYAASTSSQGWQGTYVAAGKRVDLVVSPTAAVQQARVQRTPFGDAMQRRNRSQNPNLGFHMSMKMGPQPVDMVFWSKRNWTVMIQSPDMVAGPFARAYQPIMKPVR
jgi:hypothetical protein